MHYGKKSGKRHAMIKNVVLHKEVLVEDNADGEEYKNTRELEEFEKKVFQTYITVYALLCDLLETAIVYVWQYHER